MMIHVNQQVVDIWNSLPNHVAEAKSVKSFEKSGAFKALLHEPDVYKQK